MEDDRRAVDAAYTGPLGPDTFFAVAKFTASKDPGKTGQSRSIGWLVNSRGVSRRGPISMTTPFFGKGSADDPGEFPLALCQRAVVCRGPVRRRAI